MLSGLARCKLAACSSGAQQRQAGATIERLSSHARRAASARRARGAIESGGAPHALEPVVADVALARAEPLDQMRLSHRDAQLRIELSC